MPVALRWIMVGVIEMAAAHRAEEEGEDYPKLLVINILNKTVLQSFQHKDYIYSC